MPQSCKTYISKEQQPVTSAKELLPLFKKEKIKAPLEEE
jgi:hypothetical protein